MLKDKIIDERYKIGNKIGSGGSSEVFMCTHLKLEMECAIKVIPKNKSEFFDWKKEAFLLRDLSHPKIPRIIDIVEDENNFYIIREFCEGLNLRESLNAKGPLQYEDLVAVAKQIAEVIDFFHKKNPPIIYRDLKPENIIVDEALNVRLIDLGISRYYDFDKEDDTRYIGSQKYAAPEQFGIHQSNVQTDVYSFGLLLYFLYTAEDYVDVEDKWKKFSGKRGEKLKKAIQKAISLDSESRQEDLPSLVSEAFIDDSPTTLTVPLNYSSERAFVFRPKINIAFMGLQRGVGTSHLSLVAGKVFTNMNYKVKVFDMSTIGGLEKINAFNSGYDAFEESTINHFNHLGFKIFTKDSKLDLTKMLEMDYDVGIFDFGSSHSRTKDFLKMQYKVLVLPSKPYATKENYCFLKEMLAYKEIHYLINLKDDNYKDMVDYLNLPSNMTHGLGFLNENNISSEDEKVFINICNIERKKSKKENIFKRLFL